MKALRVLVVEDDALIAMLLSELLAGMGHDVCATAASEAEAVIAAIRYDPDLMIVDAGLGRGSGVSAVERGLSHTCSSVGTLKAFGGVSRTQ
jgi:DNA-binding response OmpR family regulator